MVKERNYIVETLKSSGIKSQVYTNMKKLKQGNEVHVGAVLRNGETFTRSGSKRKFVDQEGRQKRRVKLWERNTSLHVVIADTSEENVEKILEEFLRNLKKGIDVDGNWVNIVVGEADWVEEGDSILKAKVAVQFDITFEGGIYEDRDIKPMDIGSVG
ncbi:SON protein [Candidatus Merdisoma sp. JLR.KK011]|uniref:SON protein n=1 Tax=Candidatus Merdisoma sp. JLR.KK011 TaxID=3114299 RepID=UPI002FF41A93